MKRILPALSIILLVFGLVHYFIYQVSSASIESSDLKSAYAVLLTLGLFAIPLGFAAFYAKNKKFKIITWIGYIWMGFFSNLFFFSLIGALLFIFYPDAKSYWVIEASFGIGIWALYKGLRLPKVIRHTLKKPALKGLKLVQISDLHVGLLHLNESWLKKVVERVLQLNPDIVVITGDLVEGNFKDVSPQLEVLKTLNKIPHRFYITGNHEYIHASGAWEQRLTELGFTALHNENKIISFINSRVLIAGVPDRSIQRFVRNKNSLPDVALHTNEKVDYKILLAHQPASVFDLKTENCDLILSGHTHGGQIFPFHLAVRLAQPVNAGFKLINNTLVFAHQGTGLWGPPMRWFSRSEIVLLEWN